MAGKIKDDLDARRQKKQRKKLARAGIVIDQPITPEKVDHPPELNPVTNPSAIQVDESVLELPVRIQPLGRPDEPGRVLIAFIQGDEKVLIEDNKLPDIIKILQRMETSRQNSLKPPH